MDNRLLALSQLNCSNDLDDHFGPAVDQCRRGFDFTLLFEQSILFLLPACILLIATPARLVKLWRSQIKVSRNILGFCKAVAAVILAIVWLTLVVLYSLRDKDTTRTSVSSAILGFVAAIAIFVLSHVEHKRSVRPSALLNVYLFFSALFDAVQLRSLVLSEGSSLVSSFFAINVGVKVVLLVLEAWEKRKSLADAYANLPLESTIGIFNRSFFWWLNATLRRGSRASLSPEDLQKIDTALEPRVWAKALQEAWIRHSIPNASRRALVSASIKAFRKPLAAMVFPRICLIGLNFAQPFLISRLLNLLRDPDSINNRNIGYGLIGATGAIYLGIAVLNGWYKHQLFRCITSFRGAMIAFIFDRALHLPDGVYNESKAVSLMGTDTDRICVSIERVHEVWAQLLEVLIGVSLLGLQLGWICVLPVAIVLGSTILSSKVATVVPAKQKIWAAAVQKRIAVTASAIGSMKTIRMAGLTRAVTKILVEQRTRELRLMAGFRWMSLWLNSIANIPTAFCAAVTFTAYVFQAHIEGREGLDVTRAFTSLALINLVAVPAGRFLTAFPVLTASLGCFERIQEYMLAPSRADSRILSQTMENAVELDSVKFATNNDTSTSPANITLSLRRGALTIITGPVGGGKTTLARALLGEIACEAGTICVYTTKVGYCAQTPWLLNLSIRHNICGLRTNGLFDDDWYQAVLQACALDVDMKHLVEGDETMIGSKGTKLSGGQRHRVALARCVFARPEIVVLDDVFSALDSETEQIVTERLLGPSGLLRRLGSTIILISHSVHLFRISDQMVVFGQDGSMKHCGSYVHIADDSAVIERPVSRSISRQVESDFSGTASQHLNTKSKEKVSVTSVSTGSTGEPSTYSYYAKSVGWRKGSIYVLFQAAHIITVSVPQVWLMWWTTAGNRRLALFLPIYLSFSFLQLFNQGVAIWSILVWIAASTARRLHWVLLRTTVEARQAFFASTDLGEIINRFSQDLTLVEQALPQAVMMTVGMFFMLCGQLALISLGSSYVAATLPCLFIAVYFVQSFYLRTSRQLRVLELEAKSPVYSHFMETLDGLTTIRAFDWLEESKAIILSRIEEAQTPYYLLLCIQRWLNLVLDLIVAALAVIVVALAVSLRTSTSAGRLGVSLNNVLGTSTILSYLINAWTQLETSLGAVVRIKRFESDVVPEARPHENHVPPQSWPQCGQVDIESVCATYNEGPVALKAITMRIESGQKIGICGRSGSGKSSLVSALLRLLDLQTGSVIIDGLDISSVPRSLIRDRITAVPQEVFLLTGSVRLNLDPDSLQEDEKLIDLLKRVDLWEVIESRGGLDCDINANPLSQGQLQILSLARALLRKSKIVILDEATSNVDTETDKSIQHVIREHFSGCTVISVAHRLSTILDADKIGLFEEGRLVEFDSPRNLLSRGSRLKEYYDTSRRNQR